jgi:hypothetical protein
METNRMFERTAQTKLISRIKEREVKDIGLSMIVAFLIGTFRPHLRRGLNLLSVL